MERLKKTPQRVRARYTNKFRLEAARLLKLGQKPPIKGIGIELIQGAPWATNLDQARCGACFPFNRV
ncbi:MAG: hypothetical protein Q8S10_10735 [Thiobacillus sp.]|nr:hypothetical protein [Thiobacillus sp.]